MSHNLENPITATTISSLIAALGDQASEDIMWSENVKMPETPESFAFEAIWIICNSGMKHTIARMIEKKALTAIEEGRSVTEVFGHRGKADAMDYIWANRVRLLEELRAAEDKISYLASLPWIGNITKYHLAKNCGIDCAKPDVHLQRLADRESVSVHELCGRLAKATGFRIATVDLILWRACATGIINSKELMVSG